MNSLESRDLDREFASVTRSLEIRRPRADRFHVAHQAERPEPPHGLAWLRAIAAVGVAAAIAGIVYAFTIHPLLGVTGIFASPGIPLGLMVLADRFGRLRT